MPLISFSMLSYEILMTCRRKSTQKEVKRWCSPAFQWLMPEIIASIIMTIWTIIIVIVMF